MSLLFVVGSRYVFDFGEGIAAGVIRLSHQILPIGLANHKANGTLSILFTLLLDVGPTYLKMKGNCVIYKLIPSLGRHLPVSCHSTRLEADPNHPFANNPRWLCDAWAYWCHPNELKIFIQRNATVFFSSVLFHSNTNYIRKAQRARHHVRNDVRIN